MSLLPAYALGGIPAGLVLGLLLGVPANRADGWGGYSSLSRRCARLGHVAAVMLPMLAGFYAMAVDAWALDPATAAVGAWLWLTGGPVLVAVLFLAARWPRLRYALPVPACVLVAGAFAFAFALFQTGGIQS